jgi:hypothetical protein
LQHGVEVVSPTPESQDRWRKVYAEAEERGGERVLVGAMLQRLDARRLWQNVFLVSSTGALVALFVVCYSVLTR